MHTWIKKVNRRRRKQKTNSAEKTHACTQHLWSSANGAMCIWCCAEWV